MNEYFDLKHIYDQHRITISPDAKYVSFVVRTNQKTEKTGVSSNDTNIVIYDIENKTYIYPLGTDIKSWAPSWSSDGRFLAFYSNSIGEAFLYVWDSKTKICFKATEIPLRGYVFHMDRPRWLTSHTVCVPFIPEYDWLYHTDPALISDKDDDKYFKIRADIGIVDLKNKTEKRIPTNFNAKLFFPSPDGKRLAISTFEPMKNIGKYAWTEGLYYYDIDKDSEPYLIDNELPAGGSFMCIPVWSGDSSKISYLKDADLIIYDVSCKNYKHIGTQRTKPDNCLVALCKNGGYIIKNANNLYLLFENDKKVKLDLPENQAVYGIVKAVDSDYAVTTENECCLIHTVDTAENKNCVFSVPLDGSKSKCLISENKTFIFAPFQIISGAMCDIDETESQTVYCVESINSPLELWISDIGFTNPRQLTALNPKIDVNILFKKVFWNDTAGNEQKGVIYYPSGYSSSMPLVVSVYPNVNHYNRMNSWSVSASAILPIQLMIAKGYAVFVPDLYTNDNTYLRKSICDELLVSMESVYKNMNIDRNRMFLIGNSFGGYSVYCIITQTNIFKAAVSSVGFSNLSSMYATNYGCQGVETGMGMGTPWDNPQGYIENSPLFYANNIETPLLIIDGEKEDMKNQPDEMRVALTRLNKEVSTLYYKDEGHAPTQDWSVEKQIICAKTVLDWFEKFL